jgi:hypothetical protein
MIIKSDKTFLMFNLAKNFVKIFNFYFSINKRIKLFTIFLRNIFIYSNSKFPARNSKPQYQQIASKTSDAASRVVIENLSR